MIKLLIAEDHAIVREGLKQLFALYPDVSVAGVAVNGWQALEALLGGNIDLVLLDMSIPGLSGVNLIGRIHELFPMIPILVLSMHNELHVATSAIKAGASGYLTKDNDPEILMSAIRKVASGGRFMDQMLVEMMIFEQAGGNIDPSRKLLSDREFQILKLLAQGMSVNEIAEKLSISNKTVSTHKTRLMQKLNLRNNAEIIRYGIEHGFV